MTTPLRLAALAALALLSCAPDKVQKFEEPPPPEPRCGDGTRNGSEQCEGDDLNGATCQSLGFVSGPVTCASDCTFDTSACVRTCGNGKVDPGEECDGTNVGAERCTEWGSITCSNTCRLVRTTCVTDPYAELQRVDLALPSFGAFSPLKVGSRFSTELLVAQPSRPDQGKLLGYDKDRLFDPVNGQNRRLAMDSPMAAPLVRDLNGDGSGDVILRYAGETQLTLKLSGTNGFTQKLVPLNCAPVLQVIADDVDGDKDLDLVVPACSTDGKTVSKVIVVRNDGGAFTPQTPIVLPEATSFVRLYKGALLAQVPSTQSVAVLSGDGKGGFTDKGTALAAGHVPGDFAVQDLDANGSLDVLALDATGASLDAFVDDGLGGVTKHSLLTGLTALSLTPFDADLDGKTEVAVLGQSDVTFVKVASDLTVKKQALPLNGLTPLNLDVGDTDQDGDPDVAVGGEKGGAGQVLILKALVR